MDLGDRVGQRTFAKALPPVHDRQSDRLIGLRVAQEDHAVVGLLAERPGPAAGVEAEVQDVVARVVVEPQLSVEHAFECFQRGHSGLPLTFRVRYTVFTNPPTTSATTAIYSFRWGTRRKKMRQSGSELLWTTSAGAVIASSATARYRRTSG